MGGVVGVIKEAAGFISRNYGKVKTFLVGLVETIELIDRTIIIGKMWIRMIQNGRGIIARFFSGNEEIGSTRVDRHNIDAVVDLAVQHESRYS